MFGWLRGGTPAPRRVAARRALLTSQAGRPLAARARAQSVLLTSSRCRPCHRRQGARRQGRVVRAQQVCGGLRQPAVPVRSGVACGASSADTVRRPYARIPPHAPACPPCPHVPAGSPRTPRAVTARTACRRGRRVPSRSSTTEPRATRTAWRGPAILTPSLLRSLTVRRLSAPRLTCVAGGRDSACTRVASVSPRACVRVELRPADQLGHAHTAAREPDHRGDPITGCRPAGMLLRARRCCATAAASPPAIWQPTR